MVCGLISSYLRLLIDYQPEILGVFNILSRINTNCTEMICNVIWYILCTAKAVAASIPILGSTSYR